MPYGAQRRLEIVRALATHPKIILLDEPAAGMNPSETAEQMCIRDSVRTGLCDFILCRKVGGVSVYRALYRKYRPQAFEDVVGQEHVVETIKNQIINKKISHAYMFTGTRGTGKTTCAKILARAVNCEDPNNGNPCNKCDTCKGILNRCV